MERFLPVRVRIPHHVNIPYGKQRPSTLKGTLCWAGNQRLITNIFFIGKLMSFIMLCFTYVYFRASHFQHSQHLLHPAHDLLNTKYQIFWIVKDTQFSAVYDTISFKIISE